MRVSVLDTSPIVAGSTAREALRRTVDLAELADELGYHRYWLPEHHSMRGVASAAPAVAVARIADVTSRIRVGAGGVLLLNHPPLVVAEQFGTLAAFHPGRIDLGLGRALGGPQRVAAALNPGPADSFPARLEELLTYFADSDQPLRATPALGNVPDVWLLGSSTASAYLAAELGLPYAFAYHLRPAEAAAATRIYRERFRPGRIAEPSIVVSVAVVAAATEERAEWLARSIRAKALSRSRGERILLPRPEDAVVDPAVGPGPVLAGAPAALRNSLRTVIAETGADELMITTPVHDHEERKRSYALVREISDALSTRD